jgi:hypothetical protein
MLAQARCAHPGAGWVRADVRALPFAGAFDLTVRFGALGHFLPAERMARSNPSSAQYQPEVMGGGATRDGENPARQQRAVTAASVLPRTTPARTLRCAS